MHIQIRISGDAETIARLEKLGDKLTKFKPELEQLGSEMTTYFSGQVFASQGGVIGNKWPRLSQAYAKRKAKRWPGRPMLVRTGKMIGGFRHEASENSLTVGNRMPYFRYHQSSAPRRKMPYRPMMAINDDVEHMVKVLIERGVRRRIDESVR